MPIAHPMKRMWSVPSRNSERHAEPTPLPPPRCPLLRCAAGPSHHRPVGQRGPVLRGRLARPPQLAPSRPPARGRLCRLLRAAQAVTWSVGARGRSARPRPACPHPRTAGGAPCLACGQAAQAVIGYCRRGPACCGAGCWKQDTDCDRVCLSIYSARPTSRRRRLPAAGARLVRSWLRAAGCGSSRTSWRSWQER